MLYSRSVLRQLCDQIRHGGDRASLSGLQLPRIWDHLQPFETKSSWPPTLRSHLFYKIYKMTGRHCLYVVLSLRFKLNLEISEQSLFLSSSLKECFKISPPHSGQNWIAFGPYLDHSKIVSHYLDRSEFPAQNLFYLVALLVICTKPLNVFLNVHVLKRSYSVTQMYSYKMF